MHSPEFMEVVQTISFGLLPNIERLGAVWSRAFRILIMEFVSAWMRLVPSVTVRLLMRQDHFRSDHQDTANGPREVRNRLVRNEDDTMLLGFLTTDYGAPINDVVPSFEGRAIVANFK